MFVWNIGCSGTVDDNIFGRQLGPTHKMKTKFAKVLDIAL